MPAVRPFSGRALRGEWEMPAKKRRRKEASARGHAKAAGPPIPASLPVEPVRLRGSLSAMPDEADFIAMLAAMGYFD